MTEPVTVRVDSEIGRLEGVIVHAPGPEIENMTPSDAERALYSDILSGSVSAWVVTLGSRLRNFSHSFGNASWTAITN